MGRQTGRNQQVSLTRITFTPFPPEKRESSGPDGAIQLALAWGEDGAEEEPGLIPCNSTGPEIAQPPPGKTCEETSTASWHTLMWISGALSSFFFSPKLRFWFLASFFPQSWSKWMNKKKKQPLGENLPFEAVTSDDACRSDSSHVSNTCIWRQGHERRRKTTCNPCRFRRLHGWLAATRLTRLAAAEVFPPARRSATKS